MTNILRKSKNGQFNDFKTIPKFLNVLCPIDGKDTARVLKGAGRNLKELMNKTVTFKVNK